ncbi:MAG: DUF6985 domain-containing protein [Planctomycetaceae bacterium]
MSLNADAFQFLEHFWHGTLGVPWLGTSVEFFVYIDEGTFAEYHALSQATIDSIRDICNLPLSTRVGLERFLYDYYNSSIFNHMFNESEFTPKVNVPHEIWRLVSSPGITLPRPERRLQQRSFYVTFETTWDPEHGLAIVFGADGNPIEECDPCHCN